MDIQARLEAAFEANQKNKQEKETSTDSTSTSTLTLGSKYKPSIDLPKRTAKFWADVNMGRSPIIKFFKELENGSFEIHKNATAGLEKVVDLSSLHQVLRETEYELSLTGESDIAMFYQNNTIVPLKIDLMRKQYAPNGELVLYHGIVNMDTGTAPWVMTKKFYYNDQEEIIVENEPYHRGEEGDWSKMEIDKFNNKFKQSMVHTVNLGKIPFPVVTLTNTGADRWGSGKSDTNDVKDILEKLDFIEDAITRSIKTSKTRLYNKRKNGSMDLTGSNNVDTTARQIMEDVEIIDIVEDPHSAVDGLQISDRQLGTDQWVGLRKNYLNEYYSDTGENVAADAHGNNQHTYEVQSKGDNKFRRATAKKTQRVKEIAAVLDIIIEMAKSKGAQFFSGVSYIDINIDEVDIRKEYEIEDKMEKLLNLDLISKVQALMAINGISEQAAMIQLAAKERHESLFKEEEPMVEEQPAQPEAQPTETDTTEEE